MESSCGFLFWSLRRVDNYFVNPRSLNYNEDNHMN